MTAWLCGQRPGRRSSDRCRRSTRDVRCTAERSATCLCSVSACSTRIRSEDCISTVCSHAVTSVAGASLPPAFSAVPGADRKTVRPGPVSGVDFRLDRGKPFEQGADSLGAHRTLSVRTARTGAGAGSVPRSSAAGRRLGEDVRTGRQSGREGPAMAGCGAPLSRLNAAGPGKNHSLRLIARFRHCPAAKTWPAGIRSVPPCGDHRTAATACPDSVADPSHHVESLGRPLSHHRL